MKPVVIISTYPDKRSVTKVARQLVRERTVACVNISRISSVYSWKGRIEDAAEYLAIFKTVPRNRRLLKQRIRETHPYDVPEIAELDVSSVNRPYLDWLSDSAV